MNTTKMRQIHIKPQGVTISGYIWRKSENVTIRTCITHIAKDTRESKRVCYHT